MTSNLNPKSNSSGSKSSKPTFRRAPAGSAKRRRSAGADGSLVGSSSLSSATSSRTSSGVSSQVRPSVRSAASGKTFGASTRRSRGAGSKNRDFLAQAGDAPRSSYGRRPAARPGLSGSPASRKLETGPRAPRFVKASPRPKQAPPARSEARSSRVSTGGSKAPRQRKVNAQAPAFGLRLPFSKLRAEHGSDAVTNTSRPPRRASARALSENMRSAFARMPRPHVPASAGHLRGRIMLGAGVLITLVLAFFIVAHSPLFAATDIEVKGGSHVSAEELKTLLDLPEGITLLNVNTGAIRDNVKRSPWVQDVKIERQFPHTLIIEPEERSVALIAYMPADDVAWAISTDGIWIAPVSTVATLNADGSLAIEAPSEAAPDTATVASGEGGEGSSHDAGAEQATEAAPEQGTQQPSEDSGMHQVTGVAAAAAIARNSGAILLTDVAADVDPSSGKAVSSEVIKAALAYATGFSSEFVAQIKSMSVASVEAISASLTSGVEVSLGTPENITTKERVVNKLLEQQEGVTYINVRTPDAYTFRSAPAS
ncbi:FtsQ-type POTRA domain-containing protein [Collinsella sp. AGMB00827]|uniref:FtsQ-type POTRA domain-containing protein n=1 Tax=Collinsella ureilytica TaxID=2869515 RepID=A0ABS7MKL0_9ACTN|nr:FtsQ-type POTRA domain-containing protein [Collinsella urealyticum]MBY4797911.1 FtsQ-type POTRA domain-containing protein [Collinsella urealyticum]